MGKKNKPQGSQLGRSIIKSRFGKGKGKNHRGDPTGFHTSDLDDGYDWGRLNLQSVTEQSQLNEFLYTAELAGTEFAAEKTNVTFVKPQATYGLLNKEEKLKVKKVQEENTTHLKVPRRPLWDKTTSAEELQQWERESFMAWRKGLSELQEVEGITMTPYEKNLEFWRQLWRVIERSDIIVQIVDARNPLLFRCEDLESYVREVSCEKLNLVLINKADFLSEKQRQYWAEYFDSINLPIAFFSALEENAIHLLQLVKIEEEGETSDQEEKEEAGCKDNLRGANEDLVDEEDDFCDEVDDFYDDDDDYEDLDGEEEPEDDLDGVDEPEDDLDGVDKPEDDLDGVDKPEDDLDGVDKPEEGNSMNQKQKLKNSTKLLNRGDLIQLFKTMHKGMKVQNGRTVAGLVGYPNVGKSSTINALLTKKKVSVSSTPGKTKHFQTLEIDDDLMLCDCPGLVMPSFVSTKHEMVIWGILPIDQMRDHVGPINLIASLIPRRILESTYGIFIPKPFEGEDLSRPPSSEELLNAYGFMRGFMTARGLPDNPRSSRHILKDFVCGKLLYCVPPSAIDTKEFVECGKSADCKIDKVSAAPTPFQLRVTRTNYMNAKTLDQDFFKQSTGTAHSKGRASLPGTTYTKGVVSNSFHGSTNGLAGEAKPWKKHNKSNKREKTRRLFAHLDQ